MGKRKGAGQKSHRTKRDSKGSGWRRAALAAALGLPCLGLGILALPRQASSEDKSATSTPQATPQFGFCRVGGGTHCADDGDTFWMNGVKFRIADIDAPETHQPRCAAEADLGRRAARRLHELLNGGPFILRQSGRDEDRYGRKLRLLIRRGTSLGSILVREGLARPYKGGPRAGWC